MRLPSRLLRRNPEAHKGNFGHIFVLAGSLRYSGAGVLCAAAAIKSGAGLVTLAVTEGLKREIIKVKLPEIITLPLAETKGGTFSALAYKKIMDFIKSVDVMVVGPGLTQDKSTQALIRRLVSKSDLPVVIDADGLNALAGRFDLLQRNTQYTIRPPQGAGGRPPMQCGGRNTIITPHPGEMARLLGVTAGTVQKNRERIAREFANKHKVTVILKGHNTVVSDYKGNFYINKTGNPGMATAGSGDVLSGIIASFLGQGLDSFVAAKFAVFVHGVAGDLAAKKKTQLGMIASDIISEIPEAIKKCS